MVNTTVRTVHGSAITDQVRFSYFITSEGRRVSHGGSAVPRDSGEACSPPMKKMTDEFCASLGSMYLLTMSRASGANPASAPHGGFSSSIRMDSPCDPSH